MMEPEVVADEPLASSVFASKDDVPPSVEPPARFLNRELSWLLFNRRVLAETLDERLPLLERVRFLSIFAGNLDEFFMIRVSGLRTLMATSAAERSPDGRTPAEQLAAIRRDLLPILERATRCWAEDLLLKLAETGIRILRYDELKKKQRKLLRKHFKDRIFPILTPLAFDPGHPFPHISNLSINLAVVVKDAHGREKFARLRAPVALPRLVRMPDEEKADNYDELGVETTTMAPNFVWLEEVIAANLDLLFPKMDVVASYPFRVTRDADAEIEADEAGDLLTVVSQLVERRQFGRAVRLEIDSKMPDRIRDILTVNLELSPYQVYTTTGPIGLSDLVQLAALDRPQLKYPPFSPVDRSLSMKDGLFKEIQKRDIVLHHPYDSFDTVLDFLAAAAKDPDVIAIKQTLYRLGPDSPVVRRLEEARDNDKQVAVLVELKARFDEENNIVWAQQLEDFGVHVVYGVVGLKTHAKMTLVVRREGAGIRLYVHIGTGNYNAVTGRLYTDLGLLTCSPDIARDVVDLFNGLTGYSAKTDYNHLVVAPESMRSFILGRIEREMEHQRAKGTGHIAWKCNALSDERIIDALYKASSEGVKIELQVRGICCLRPRVPGLSESITVTSVVGRLLEHARIYYFFNGGEEELLLGSADMMPRNLDSRVELLTPIRDPLLRTAVRDSILRTSLDDTAKCWVLRADGSYSRREPAHGQEPFNSQEFMMARGGAWRQD
ncbi:MAG TPA: polyphosphate kinase 1 [Polyangiaceae bacterium]|nr:polyphosphate kinase 1 [Polyangiaceae bacterium]